MALMLPQPSFQVEIIILFGPEHAGESLAMHPMFIFAERFRGNPLVEFVGVRDAVFERGVETGERIFYAASAQAETDFLASTGGHFDPIMGRGLGSSLGGIHRVGASRDDVFMKRVLDVGRDIRLAPQTLGIALVFGKEQLRDAITIKPVFAK